MNPDMTKRQTGLIVGMAGFMTSAALVLSAAAPVSLSTAPARIADKITDMRLPFVANQGQIENPEVAFYAPTLGGTVFVTPRGEIGYALAKYQANAECSRPNPPAAGSAPSLLGVGVIRERALTSAAISPIGAGPAQTKVHSFVGDRTRWRTDLAAFETVSLGEVAPGVTLTLNAYNRNVEKIITVAPGADPAEIEFRVAGATRMTANAAGELALTTALGNVRFSAPVAWQEQAGIRRPVAVAYRVDGDQYGFEVGEYDDSLPLVIDPLLASTYLGGADDDYARAIATDASGNIYMAGYTRSSDFPTTAGVYDPTYNGYPHTNGYIIANDYDVVISKLDASLTHLLASTYLGGKHEDEANALKIDETGNVYVMGYTKSYNFPVTPGAYSTNFNGGNYTPPYEGLAEVFISKLDGALSNLLASTFLGGTTGDDYGYALALASPTNLYVTGTAGSTNFPVTSGAYDTTPHDVFISKLDRGLSNLVASTFLGGSRGEAANSLAVDASGNVYVSGFTVSSNFPVTAGAYQTILNHTNPAALYYDAFVSRFDSGLAHLLASTFLGGNGGDFAQALALDSSSNVYIAGYSQCWDFPVTPNAYDDGWTIRWAGEYDAFVSKFNPTLTNLMASTCLGGVSRDYAYALAIDQAGHVFVGGNTESIYNPTDGLNFPVTPGAYDTHYHTWTNESATPPDAFISQFDNQLTNLLASTLLGGSLSDYIQVLCLDASTNVLAAGYTDSDDFPVLNGAYATNRNGGKDIFISKLDAALSGETSGLQPPANVSASAGAYTDKIQVTWSTVTNATSYEIWRYTSSESNLASRLAATTALVYNDTNVTADVVYYYWIISRNASGVSAFSVPASGYVLAPVMPTPITGDFDGDGKSDPALYVESTGVWYVKLSNAGYGLVTLSFGGAGYTPCVGDFDGDGKADPAVYQTSTGNWSVKLSGSDYAVATMSAFGGPDYAPVAADYDGDGKADPAIYNMASGDWQVAMSSLSYGRAAASGFGGTGYTAVQEQYDTDNRADAAIYNTATGNWTILLSAQNYITATLWDFGGAGYAPVSGDFDDDGRTDPTIYQETTGNWSVKLSGNNYTTATLAGFGGVGYGVTAADFDGDRKADPTLLDMATGIWHIRLSNSGYGEATLASGWTP